MKYYENKNITLYHGDNKIEMKSLFDDSIDLIVTDPPYGITFMGKQWDIDVPSIETWKECLRVLKPGAFAFIMSSPRQDVLSEMISRVRHAGFDTNFTSIYWTYASGFPKAMNMSKAVDKRFNIEPQKISKKGTNQDMRGGAYTSNIAKERNRINTYITIPSSKDAKEFDGSYAGFQPKPAVEVIIVAMKPLSEKSFIDQTLNNGKGITWLDNCRIPYQNENDKESTTYGNCTQIQHSEQKYGFKPKGKNVLSSPIGRFPANLVVSDDILNDGNITKSSIRNIESTMGGFGRGINTFGNNINSLIQSERGYEDSGSFSRYFDIDKWFEETIKKLPEDVQKVFPFLIVPKAAKSERNEGCENIEPIYNDDSRHDKTAIGCNNPRNRSGTAKTNFHPTVKPLKLISYLITLGSRPSDIILDPFIGSGTTCISANLLERKSIGIEIDLDYIEIAKSKIMEVTKQIRFI